MVPSDEIWSLFVQYPNRDQVLRELHPPRDLAELRTALEVFDDQHLLVADQSNKSQFMLVERADQLYDGASLRVTVPRRRIFVTLDGTNSTRQVAWYPGASAEQIENAIAKACGLAVGTAIELLDGDVAVVISATVPNDSAFTAVPLTTNGASAPATASANGTGSGRPTPNVPPRRSGDESPGGQRRGGYGTPSYTPTVPGVTRTGSVPARAPGGGAATRSRSNTPQCGGALPGPLPGRAETEHPRTRSGVGSGSVGGPAASSRAASPSRDLPVDLAAQPTGRVSAPDEHCVHILAGHAGHVLSLCTVGDVLFTGSQDCNIMIWDLNNLQYIGTLPGHRGFVKCMAAALSRKVLCSGSQDKTIKVWSLESFSSQKTLHGHTADVNSLAILEGTDVLVSGSEDRSIRVWDLGSLSLITTLEQAHGSGVFALAQLDGGLFVSASRDRTLKVWVSSTWQARRTLSPPHFDGVTDLTVGASRSRFYSASRDRSIRRWDARSFESDLQLNHSHGDWLTSLAMSPSENVLYSGSKDCVVKVWDPDLHCKDLLLGHRGPISSLLSVDGHLFSASHDRTVRVWRVGQYEPGGDA